MSLTRLTSGKKGKKGKSFMMINDPQLITDN